MIRAIPMMLSVLLVGAGCNGGAEPSRSSFASLSDKKLSPLAVAIRDYIDEHGSQGLEKYEVANPEKNMTGSDGKVLTEAVKTYRRLKKLGGTTVYRFTSEASETAYIVMMDDGDDNGVDVEVYDLEGHWILSGMGSGSDPIDWQ